MGQVMDGGSGHCLCGKIRYAFDGEPNWQGHCHCESCRRATGSGIASFLGVSDGRWRWTGDQPAAFASSAGAVRYFCPKCGTPIAYRGDRWPDEIHFHAGTLDDPASFAPTSHDHADERLRWVPIEHGQPQVVVLRRFGPDENPAPVLRLIREAFSPMDGRIDPPSSAHRLDADEMRRIAGKAEIWVIEDPARVIATVTLSLHTDRVQLGKMAVAEAHRGKGLARILVEHAERRARALDRLALELQSRVELTENHAVFARLGFREIARTAHPGYDHPTSITFRKPIG